MPPITLIVFFVLWFGITLLMKKTHEKIKEKKAEAASRPKGRELTASEIVRLGTACNSIFQQWASDDTLNLYSFVVCVKEQELECSILKLDSLHDPRPLTETIELPCPVAETKAKENLLVEIREILQQYNADRACCRSMSVMDDTLIITG